MLRSSSVSCGIEVGLSPTIMVVKKPRRTEMERSGFIPVTEPFQPLRTAGNMWRVTNPCDSDHNSAPEGLGFALVFGSRVGKEKEAGSRDRARFERSEDYNRPYTSRVEFVPMYTFPFTTMRFAKCGRSGSASRLLFWDEV